MGPDEKLQYMERALRHERAKVLRYAANRRCDCTWSEISGDNPNAAACENCITILEEGELPELVPSADWWKIDKEGKRMNYVGPTEATTEEAHRAMKLAINAEDEPEV